MRVFAAFTFQGFLDRSDGVACRITNKSNLKELLGRFGFVRVLPDKLSFAEQVKITNNADVVISCMVRQPPILCSAKGATFAGLTTNNPAVNSFFKFSKALGVRFEQLAFKATFSSLIIQCTWILRSISMK